MIPGKRPDEPASEPVEDSQADRAPQEETARSEAQEAPPQPFVTLGPDDELVPADDHIIARAFRLSLLAIGAVGLVVLVVVWWLGKAKPAVEGAEVAVAPPVAARAAVTAPELWFTDITREAGIEWVHFSGATGEKLLPETMGGGGGFFDFNNNGHQDLLLVNGTHWPHDPAPPGGAPPTLTLYLNDGTGRFTDVTHTLGIDETFYAMGVAFGDFDGDGYTDIFVTAVGENRLYRNVEGRDLEDVTHRAGVAGGPDSWSTCAAFFDSNNNGLLDLFVCNYVVWSREIDFELDFRLTGVGRAYGPPLNYEGTDSYLYRNNGDGTFTEVSAEAGIQVANPATGVPVGKALGVVPVDVDGDGHIDLVVANDTTRNFFFHNQGDGTFLEMGELYGVAYDRDGSATGAMGIDAGYYRNDDGMTFAIGNFANEMTSLYVSQGDPTLYADEAIVSGIGGPTRTMLTFGVLLLDVDLDGRLDLLQANGHLEEEINVVDPSQTYRQPTQLFWNAGAEASRPFEPVPRERTGDLATPIVGRGAAFADIDGDGDLDLLLIQIDGPPLLLRNDQQTGHHWLRIQLVGDGGNREAIGAWVEVTAGEVTQRRQVMPTRGYLTQSELPVTFGLGSSPVVDSIVVTWPDGTRQEVAPGPVDRLQVVRKET
jgi:enediyne biosynthesis protein E4